MDKKFKNLKEMYMFIYEDRDKVSEISGKPLLHPGHPKFIWQFMHVLSKGAYPEYKMKPFNIMLGLPNEHENQEQFPAFIEKRDFLKTKYYKEVVGNKFED